MVIRYADRETAKKACTTFKAAYLPDADPEGVAQTEDKRWAAAHISNRCIIAVFDAATRDRALHVLEEITTTVSSMTHTGGIDQ